MSSLPNYFFTTNTNADLTRGVMTEYLS